jgi:hypothetical protein
MQIQSTSDEQNNLIGTPQLMIIEDLLRVPTGGSARACDAGG